MKFILDSLNSLKISENSLGIFVCSENLITCDAFKISKYGKMQDHDDRKKIFPGKHNFLELLERKGFGLDAVLAIEDHHFWFSGSLYEDQVVIIIKKLEDTLFYRSGLSFIAPFNTDGIKDYFLIQDRFHAGNLFLNKDFKIENPSLIFDDLPNVIIDFASPSYEKYFKENFPEKKCPTEYESESDYDEDFIFEIYDDALYTHPNPCVCVIKEFTSVWQWDSYRNLYSYSCYIKDIDDKMCFLKDVLLNNIELKDNANFEDKENAVYLKKMIHKNDYISVRDGFNNSFGSWSHFTINNPLNLCNVKKKNLDFSSEYRNDIYLKIEKFYYQFVVDTKKVFPEYLEYFLESKYFKSAFYANDPFDTGQLDNEDITATYPMDDEYNYYYLTKHVYENSLIFLPSIADQKIIVKKDQLMKEINSELTDLKLSLIGNIDNVNSIKSYDNALLDLKNMVVNVREQTPYIAKILSDGENLKSEFKSAYHARLDDSSELRKSNYKSNMSKEDSRKCIEYSALKAICAFLNTNGGSVFIGINETDGKPVVVGIDNEMKKFHKNSEDEYIRFIQTRMNQFFDKKSEDEIKMMIHNTGGQKVLEIKCGHVLESLLDGKELWTRRPNNVYLVLPIDRYEHLKAREKNLVKVK